MVPLILDLVSNVDHRKRYPIEDMLVVKEDEEKNAILRKQGLPVTRRPSFPNLEIFPEDYTGDAIQVR